MVLMRFSSRQATLFLAVTVAALTVAAPSAQASLASGFESAKGHRAGDLLSKTKLTLPAGTTGIRGWRIRYTTLRGGKPVVSSGMLLEPTGKAPRSGRKIVAWAHPTLGMGKVCAPSAKPFPPPPAQANPMSSWMLSIVRRGWVVVATDYAGLGTRGTLPYLVGPYEATDVITSVVAARRANVSAGTDYAVVGFSQGGHASLWSPQKRSLARGMRMRGVVGAAPAADLPGLFRAQQGKPLWPALEWLLGSEIVAAWPVYTPGLSTKELLTTAGKANYKAIAKLCISPTDGAAAQKLIIQLISQGKALFTSNPMTNAAWLRQGKLELPPSPPRSIPVLITQGDKDPVILPETNVATIKRLCRARNYVDKDWVVNTGSNPALYHEQALTLAAGRIADWLSDRFAGRRATSVC